MKRLRYLLAAAAVIAAGLGLFTRGNGDPGFSSPVYLGCTTDSIVNHLSNFDMTLTATATARAAKVLNPDLLSFIYWSPTSHTQGGATPQFTADFQWRAFVAAQGHADSVAENLYLHFSDTTIVRRFRCVPWLPPAQTCDNTPCAASCATSYGCLDTTYYPGDKVPIGQDFVTCIGGQLGINPGIRWVTRFNNPLSVSLFRRFLLSKVEAPLPGGAGIFPDGIFLDNAAFFQLETGDRLVTRGGHFQEAGPTILYESGYNGGMNRWLRGPGKWNEFCMSLNDSLEAYEPRKYLMRNAGLGSSGSGYFFADTTGAIVPGDSLFRQDMTDFALFEFMGSLEIGGNLATGGNIDWPMLLYKREKLHPDNSIVLSPRMDNFNCPGPLCVSYEQGLYGIGALGYAAACPTTVLWAPLIGRQNTWGTAGCHTGGQSSLDPCVTPSDHCYTKSTYLPMWAALRDTLSAAYLGDPIGDLQLHASSTSNGRPYKIWRRDYTNGKVFVRTKDQGATTIDPVLTNVLVDPPDMNGSPLYQRVSAAGTLEAAVQTYQMPSSSGLVLVSAAGAPVENFTVTTRIQTAVQDTVGTGTRFWADFWVKGTTPWRAAAFKIHYDSTRVMPVRYDYMGPGTLGCMADFDDITAPNAKCGTRLADADIWALYDKAGVATTDSQLVARVQFFPFASGAAIITTSCADAQSHELGSGGVNQACMPPFGVFNEANAGAGIITGDAGSTLIRPSHSAYHVTADTVVVTGSTNDWCTGNWDNHPPKEGTPYNQVGGSRCAPLAIVFAAEDSSVAVDDTLEVRMAVFADSVNSVEGFIEYGTWCGDGIAANIPLSFSWSTTSFDQLEFNFDYDITQTGDPSYRVSNTWAGVVPIPPSLSGPPYTRLAYFKASKANGSKVSHAGRLLNLNFTADSDCQDVFTIGVPTAVVSYGVDMPPKTYIGNGAKLSWTSFNYGNAPINKGSTYIYERARHLWLGNGYFQVFNLNYTYGN